MTYYLLSDIINPRKGNVIIPKGTLVKPETLEQIHDDHGIKFFQVCLAFGGCDPNGTVIK